MYRSLKEREKKILFHYYEQGLGTVSELCKQLDVSAVTLRSDLERLEEKGFLVRSRGGIQATYHPSVIESVNSRSDEKHRIAKQAAEMVEDGDSIIVVAGSTTALIPLYLYTKKDVQIVTNSTLVLQYARINPNLKVTLVGGEFVAPAEAMAGAIALRELDRFFVQKSFVGTDGFSTEYGITANLTELAEFVKKSMAHSTQTVLVADSSKYSKRGFARIGSLDKIQMLITDKGLTDDKQELIKKHISSVVLV